MRDKGNKGQSMREEQHLGKCLGIRREEGQRGKEEKG